jgi:hypothetical protein
MQFDTRHIRAAVCACVCLALAAITRADEPFPPGQQYAAVYDQVRAFVLRARRAMLLL